MMPKLLRSTIGIAAFVLAAGTASAQQDASKLADYKLGPGDSIKVQVYQNPDLSVEARVSESGVVNYPLIGAVQIGGLSIGQRCRSLYRGRRRVGDCHRDAGIRARLCRSMEMSGGRRSGQAGIGDPPSHLLASRVIGHRGVACSGDGRPFQVSL